MNNVRLWKILGMWFFSFGLMVLMIWIVPEPSIAALIIASAVAFGFLICGLILRRTGNYWAKVGAGLALTGMFFLIGLRMVTGVSRHAGLWAPLLIASFAFSWLLPWLFPSLSDLLYREQTHPKGPIGKILLRIGTVGLPAAGILGGFGAIALDRRGELETGLLVGGFVGVIAADAMGQYLSHSLYRERKQKHVVTAQET